jgi:nicotinamide riboside transporter PnuC
MNRWKRYLQDMGPVTLFYVASVFVAGVLSKRMDPGALRIVVALIPMPSIVWMAYAELRRLRRRDELRQHVEVEAMTIAFAVSFCVIVMLSFLDLFGALKTSLPVAGMIMAVCWLAAQIWVRVRYRYWA